MLLQKLKAIRAELDAVISGLEVDVVSPPPPIFTPKPLPADAPMAYDACKALWGAAQSAYTKGDGWKKPDGLPFTIFDYVSGIQVGGQHRAPPKTPVQMQADITALGFTPEGKEWLSHDVNASQLHPDYQRHFLGYVTARVNQNDDSQGYRRVP